MPAKMNKGGSLLFILILAVCAMGAGQALFVPDQPGGRGDQNAPTGGGARLQLEQVLQTPDDYSYLVEDEEVDEKEVIVLDDRRSGPVPWATALFAIAIAFILMFFPRWFGIRADRNFK